MKDQERERDRMVSGDANFGEEPEGSSVSRSETELRSRTKISSPIVYSPTETSVRVVGIEESD